MKSARSDIIEATLQSPCLYRGEFRAIEDPSDRPARRFGGQRIKELLQPVLYGFLRNAPVAIALLPFRLIVGIARGFYWCRRNPLRRSCEDICKVARAAGYRHEPKEIYRRYLANVIATARAYHTLLRSESQVVLDLVDASDVQRAQGANPLNDGKAYILFCAHNLAAIYGSVALAASMPLLIIIRNSKTIRRTQLALDVLERLHARILMVRGGNPFEISRAMFSALDDNQVLAATVDNVDPGFGAAVKIFGVEVEFAPWAARIAAKRRVPVVPVYFHSLREGARVAFGEPLVTGDPVAAIRHYVSFFEKCILQDPASWIYLVDRKWCRVLRQAAVTLN
jgi:lauroyl/myristoyl acyltransferase